ncbi:DNA polymerase III subunit beta [bacterium]|nr:DNA polymerase III subunit beta [bacterium]
MKFSCDRIKLQDVLSTLQSVVATNTTLPILSNILIEASDKKELTLTATNLEVGTQFKIEADISESGSCTLPGKKLFEIAREMIGASIDIEISSDYIGIIKSGNAVYRLMGLASDEFPRLPRLDKVHSVKMAEDAVKDLFKKTAYAISNDETRYVLNGVYFIISKGEIVVVATDGRRLAMVKRKCDVDANLEVGIIIPAKTIHELVRLLHGEKEIEILFSETHVGFKRDRMLMISRLIEGKFPNYEQVIPKKTREKVDIGREEFLHLVRRVALITDGRSNMVKFKFHDGSLTLTATNPEIGEAKDDMPIEYNKEEFNIAFNPAFLVDALKALEEEKISIEFSDSTAPGVIKNEEDFTYVIMPMKLR